MGKLTEKEIALLYKNPNVVNILDGNRHTHIYYSDEFKQHFADEYKAGKGPTAIFQEAGFDTNMLGKKRIERAAARWRKSYLNEVKF